MHSIFGLKLIFWLSEQLKGGGATSNTILHFNLYVSNKLVMHTIMTLEVLYSFQRERSEQHQNLCILQIAMKGKLERLIYVSAYN